MICFTVAMKLSEHSKGFTIFYLKSMLKHVNVTEVSISVEKNIFLYVDLFCEKIYEQFSVKRCHCISSQEI